MPDAPSPTQDTDRAGSDRALIAALFGAGLLAAAQFGKIALTLPDMGAAYGLAPVRLAYLVSIVGVTGILLGAMAGTVVAALGARRVLLWALWAGAALSVFQAFLPPEPVLALTRIAEGASHLVIVVAAPTLIAGAASDAARPVAMAIWATFFGVSFALAAVLFPPLLAAVGLPGLFALHGAGLAAMAVVLAPMLRTQTRVPLRLDPVAVHRSIYAVPHRAMPGVCFVFYTVLFVALVALLPLALGRPALAGVLPVLTLAGTFLAGPLSRRLHPAAVMATGFAGTLLCAGLAATGLGGALWAMFLAMGLVPGGAFALIPHLNRAPADRALATGGIAQMGNVGTTLGTPLFAGLYAAGGTGAIWAGIAVFSLLGLAVLARFAHLIARPVPSA